MKIGYRDPKKLTAKIYLLVILCKYSAFRFSWLRNSFSCMNHEKLLRNHENLKAEYLHLITNK